ncbi:UPF0175 family protein [Crocosphaera sp. UHCC 0190]|uniref:UPF0175 family protein n=1 Tax=Crocosphaera sp. UHCC 0190 TaxID=3110246 RepID=UPI002B1F8D93|nr:UPF0175 family protein [Crocosphaera sp. UHCC 0190]MEA5511830.1 UPF0175 family protein [Crocosphaera sp. UHCC 0190]
MQIIIEVPDDIKTRMEEKWGNLSQKMMTNLALEAYQNQLISTAELGEMLNMPSRLETHAFLKQAGINLNYDEDELEKDLITLQELRQK